MAIPKGIQRLLVGVSVRTKKSTDWHELYIPKGTVGVITSCYSGAGGAVVKVKFDDGRKYWSFEFYARDLDPA